MELFFLIFGVVLGGMFCLLLRYRLRVKKIITNHFEKHETPNVNDVTQRDIAVLSRARMLLSNESYWSKNYFEHCVVGEKQTLYCALALAAKEITGDYNEKETYRQLLLENILEKFPSRYHDLMNPKNSKDPLKNFNNHKKTIYMDVLILLDDVLLKYNPQEIR